MTRPMTNAELDGELRNLFDAAARPALPPALAAYPAITVRRQRTAEPAGRPSRWRAVPAAIAAGLAIVAIATAALLLRGGTGPAASRTPVSSIEPSGSGLPVRADGGDVIWQRTTLGIVTTTAGVPTEYGWDMYRAGSIVFAVGNVPNELAQVRRATDFVTFGTTSRFQGIEPGDETRVFGIAFDGRRYFAIGTVIRIPVPDYHGVPTVWTSNDGDVWLRHPATGLGSLQQLDAVAYGPAGFVAVSGATLWHSDDGIVWTSAGSVPKGDGYGIRLLVSNGIYLGVFARTDGVVSVMRSTDGRAWEDGGLAARSLSAFATPAGFAAALSNASESVVVETSRDGLTWTVQPTPGTFESCTAAPLFCIGPSIGLGPYWLSSDGVHWLRANWPDTMRDNVGSYIGGPTPDPVYIGIEGPNGERFTYAVLPK